MFPDHRNLGVTLLLNFLRLLRDDPLKDSVNILLIGDSPSVLGFIVPDQT